MPSNSWCPWSGLNARPLPYQGSALPLSYMGGDRCRRYPGRALRFAYSLFDARSLGAGEGNRTLVVSLEGFCSTIELHPRIRQPRSGRSRPRGSRRHHQAPENPFPVSLCLIPEMVEGEGFEPSKAEPADLQSAPFNRSGTPPTKLAIIAISVPVVKRIAFACCSARPRAAPPSAVIP